MLGFNPGASCMLSLCPTHELYLTDQDQTVMFDLELKFCNVFQLPIISYADL